MKEKYNKPLPLKPKIGKSLHFYSGKELLLIEIPEGFEILFNGYGWIDSIILRHCSMTLVYSGDKKWQVNYIVGIPYIHTWHVYYEEKPSFEVNHST